MKKRNAVAFGGTSNQAFAIACVMMDLKRLCSHSIDEVVIFHDGIGRKDRNLLRKILPTRFIRYRFPIRDKRAFNQGTLHYFSEMVFSKFEVFRLLDWYQNVLFTDYDIVITQDISELLLPCSSGIKLLLAEQPVSDALHSPVDEFDMEAKMHSVAFIGVHEGLAKAQEIRLWCYLKTEEYASHLYLPEQAVFNFAIEHFGLEPVHVDPDIYCLHPKDLSRQPNPKILHAYGSEKFWSGVHNEQWNKNYHAWVKSGGTPNRPRRQRWSLESQTQKVKDFVKKVIGR